MTHRSQTVLYLSLVAAFSLLHTTQGIISLDVSPDSIQSGNRTCQNTQVVFNCSANIVSVVQWKRNDTEIRTFTLRETAPIEVQVGAFTVFLNGSVILSGETTRNATSSLIADLSDFVSGDVIQCLDGSGESITLNFTPIGIPPEPVYLNTSIGRNSTGEDATFAIIWNEQFNTQNDIQTYRLTVNGDSSITCPPTCLHNKSCVCSGLFAGRNVTSNISITAVNCNTQEGPPVVISITPLTPDQPSSCRILPVYNATGRLIDLDISWNIVSNPGNFSSKLSQNVLNYSLSLDTILPIETSCRNASKMCSVRYYSYYNQPSNLSRLSLNASVAAENIIGTGPSQMCTLPNNGIIAPNNTLFTLSVMPAEGTIECNLIGTVDNFTCEFCYRLETCEVFTDQECASGDVTLTRTSGSYCYRATAFRNGIPIAIVNGSFLISPAAPDVPKALLVTSIVFFVLADVLVAIILIAWLLYYRLGGESAKPPVKITVTIIVLFVIAILSVFVSLFLILAYSRNKSGATGRNLLAASLSFSLLSLVFTTCISSMIVIIIIIYKRKTKSETVTDLKKGNTEEFSDEDEHEGVEGYKLDY